MRAVVLQAGVLPIVGVVSSCEHLYMLRKELRDCGINQNNYFLVVLYKMADSDSESIGTEDIIEPELEPEEPELEPEPEPEPAPVPEPVPEPVLKNEPHVKVLKKSATPKPHLKSVVENPNVPVEAD
jgi:hypothetical protein